MKLNLRKIKLKQKKFYVKDNLLCNFSTIYYNCLGVRDKDILLKIFFFLKKKHKVQRINLFFLLILFKHTLPIKFVKDVKKKRDVQENTFQFKYNEDFLALSTSFIKSLVKYISSITKENPKLFAERFSDSLIDLYYFTDENFFLKEYEEKVLFFNSQHRLKKKNVRLL